MRRRSLTTSRHQIGAYLVLAAASLTFAAAQELPTAVTVDEKTGAVYSSESGTLIMRQGRTEKWRVNLGLSQQDKIQSLALGQTGELYAAGSRNQSGFLVKLAADGSVAASLPTARPVRAVAIDTEGAVWLAGDSFLTRLDAQLRTVFNVDPQGSVVSLAIDRKGTVNAAIVAGDKAIAGRLDAKTSSWAWRTDLGGVAPRGIAVDEDGSVYITGNATAPALIVSHAAQDHLIGSSDAFVTRIDSNGAVQWSTYLGGSGTDSASSIVVTTDGMATIGGSTTSPDFPGAAAPWSGTARGFLALLRPDGSVAHSDYLERAVTSPLVISRRINRGDTAVGVMKAALRSPISMSADPCNIVVTSTADSGPGSLRQAIADASGCSGTSTILFGVTGTITLSSRILINTNVNIIGQGIANLTISGNNLTRIFFVGTGTTSAFSATVTISNLTLANGFGKGGGTRNGGGGAGMGGAIFQNGGTLTLTNVLLLGNRVLGGTNDGQFDGGGGFGGDAVAGRGADGGDLGGTGGADGDTGVRGGNGGDGAGGGVGGAGNAQTFAGIGGAGGFGAGGGMGGVRPEGGNSGGPGGFGASHGQSSGDFIIPGPSGFGGGFNSGAGFGGAVFARSGSLILTNTYFEDNSAVGGGVPGDDFSAGKGGGLFLYQPLSATYKPSSGTGASATASASHFLVNSAPQAGVAIASGAGNDDTAVCPGLDTADVCGILSGTSQSDTVSLTAGNNQSVLTGQGFPVNLKLQVTNSGTGVSGVPVIFTIQPANGAGGNFGGSVTSFFAITDASGFAIAPQVISSGSPGAFTVRAAGVVFHLNIVTPVLNAKPGTTPQSTAVNTSFTPLSVTLTDNQNNPLIGKSVTFTAPGSGASGTFSNNTSSITLNTDASGVATAPFTSNTATGSYQVTASALGIVANFSLTNIAGPPASITAGATSTPQSTPINSTFAMALDVTVKDSFGNPVNKASVLFTAPDTGASGTFTNRSITSTVITVPSGAASEFLTANNTGGGPYIVTASVNGLTATFSLTNTASPVVTTNPTDQTVPTQSTATFMAAASGFPAPSLRWQVSTGGGAFTDIAGATSTTLSFPVDPSQSGNKYRAVFTNSTGSATSTAATLTVNKLNPAITWANPADIVFGTPLGAAQLNASTTVAGTFAYTPSSSTVLSAGNGETLSVLFTPADSTNYSTATATVHINVLPLQSVTMMQPASGQYSDVVTLSATVSQIIGSGSLQFQVAGVNAGPAVPVSAPGTYSLHYTISNAAGTYGISATFIPSTTSILGSLAGNTLTVTNEDAAITTAASNPPTVQVNAAGGTAGPITFAAKVTETADGSLGDINKAVVTLTLIPAGAGTLNVTCPVTNTNGSLTATCSDVPVNAYTVRWSFTGNYYQGATVNTVLAIFDPSLGFVTGSGTVLDNGVRSDFSLSVKYQKNASLQGGLSYVEHRAGGDVTVSSTFLSSMSIIGSTAVIIGQAKVNGVAGYALELTVTDNGEPGINRDTFGLQLSGGTLTPPISFASTPIIAGNLQMH